jgi:hypothetical protein
MAVSRFNIAMARPNSSRPGQSRRKIYPSLFAARSAAPLHQSALLRLSVFVASEASGEIKELLNVKPVATEPTDAAGTEAPEACEAQVMRCPKCGGVMKLVGEITPKRTRAP